MTRARIPASKDVSRERAATRFARIGAWLRREAAEKGESAPSEGTYNPPQNTDLRVMRVDDTWLPLSRRNRRRLTKRARAKPSPSDAPHVFNTRGRDMGPSARETRDERLARRARGVGRSGC